MVKKEKVFLITVKNNSDEWKDYELFNEFENRKKIKDGIFNFNGVEIKSSMADIDYGDILIQSSSSPFKVETTYVISDNIDKLLSENDKITYGLTDANSRTLSRDIFLKYSPLQQQKNCATISGEPYSIDAFAKLNGKIPPNSELLFQFYTSQIWDNN